MSMGIENRIFVGVLIATSAWLLKIFGVFLVRRYYTKRGILDDLRCLLKACRKDGRGLSEFQKLLQEGFSPEYAGSRKALNFHFCDVIQADLLLFLPDYLTKIRKLYSGLRDVDHLISGYLEELVHWKSEKRQLNKKDIEYLKLKITRINSYFESFPKNDIAKLSKLPEYYDLDPVSSVIGNEGGRSEV